MAILTRGFFDCGFNTLREKRVFSLHRVSAHRSRKGSLSVHSSSYPENEKGVKKGPRKTGGLSHRKGASNWWLPLFGWSPDHKWAEEKEDKNSIESGQNIQHSKDKKSDEEEEEEEGQIRIKRRSKSVAVNFTAEKAKILRKNLRSTSTFHDVMYHSAIATRLASADTSSEEEEQKKEKA